MSQNNKPKEFWLYFNCTPCGDNKFYDKRWDLLDKSFYIDYKETHVIEFSAYQQLQSELRMAMQANSKASEEINELKNKLKSSSVLCQLIDEQNKVKKFESEFESVKAENEKLRSELSELKKYWEDSDSLIFSKLTALVTERKQLESQLTAEREASKRLVEALEFYADGQKYLDHAVNISIPINKKKTSSIDDDMGRISRLALSEYKKARGEE